MQISISCPSNILVKSNSKVGVEMGVGVSFELGESLGLKVKARRLIGLPWQIKDILSKTKSNSKIARMGNKEQRLSRTKSDCKEAEFYYLSNELTELLAKFLEL